MTISGRCSTVQNGGSVRFTQVEDQSLWVSKGIRAPICDHRPGARLGVVPWAAAVDARTRRFLVYLSALPFST